MVRVRCVRLRARCGTDLPCAAPGSPAGAGAGAERYRPPPEETTVREEAADCSEVRLPFSVGGVLQLVSVRSSAVSSAAGQTRVSPPVRPPDTAPRLRSAGTGPQRARSRTVVGVEELVL